MPDPTYPPPVTFQGHVYTAALPYSWARIGAGGWVPVQVVGGDSLCACCRVVPSVTNLCPACLAARCWESPAAGKVCRVRR